MIVINYKTYDESSGYEAVSLTQKLESIAKAFSTPVVVAPNTVDLETVIQNTTLAVWAQHVDAKDEGQSTGWLPATTAKEIGVQGVLLNHSEHKLENDVLQETVARCKEVGLQTLIFAGSPKEAIQAAQFKPNYIGYEPAELVGSKTTSVAKAKPEVIEQVVQAISDVDVLVGAGIKSAEDIRVSMKLGAKGIAISSAIVLAEQPGEKLKELLQGFSNE